MKNKEIAMAWHLTVALKHLEATHALSDEKESHEINLICKQIHNILDKKKEEK